MRKLVIPAFVALVSVQELKAQTLFNYGQDKVSKEEFLRVYQKNAFNKKPDMSEAALREYLDLYSLFKMKVKEAELNQIDTIPSINGELTNYRKQVAKTYLTDDAINNKLIREAYDRKKEEVRVAHILLMMPRNGNPDDTLKIKNRIDSIYKAITVSKVDFSALAKQHSDDAGSKANGGDIGYITSMQTVYPFEQATYNTKKGTVSAPFRTQFGYHIVKVIDRRPTVGEVQVAQILLTTPESKGAEGKTLAQLKMDTIQAELKKGTSFEQLVKKYSEDKFTNEQDGVLPAFGTGRMVPAFEQAAFALKKPGDISQPVTTEYGIHLIKLIKKIPLAPYDTIYNALKRQVENDSRSQQAKEAYVQKVKADNGFKEDKTALEEVMTRIDKLPDTGRSAGRFDAADFSKMNKMVFAIGGKNYLQSDFVQYMWNMTRGAIMGPRRAVVGDVYRMYQETVINDYQEQKLAETNPDFKQLMKDYRDGIMLFELMDRKIWTAASRDSIGLEKYYAANATKYKWDAGFRGVVYTAKDEASMKKVVAAANKSGAQPEDVAKEVNTESNQDAMNYRTGYFEYARNTDLSAASIVPGKMGVPIKNADGSYTIIKADQVYASGTQKTLDEARGFVISEYQDKLEKDWNASLRSKYPVKVDEAVFKSMIGK